MLFGLSMETVTGEEEGAGEHQAKRSLSLVR